MLDELFKQAYPMARRAAGVRLANAVAQGTVAPSERPDLEQDLSLAVWRALPKYDARRASLRRYIEVVVANALASLVRTRRRGPMLEHLDYIEPASLDGIPAVEFRADLQRVLAGLTERDRRLATYLLDGSPTQASRAFRISRSTVYERIRRIRTAFANAGFGPSEGRTS